MLNVFIHIKVKNQRFGQKKWISRRRDATAILGRLFKC